ncbi:GDSL esterase/lipase At5g08460-like [Pistacia vera]|uniref:GDSL esterase/lipase At5g08460-like n=1 Tax=Pistacia vera TaxID=55513 RepID=UPI001263D7A5|nr:GDSL esterase/lipase At5g08460-like [Pistacia vera]
MEKPNSGLAEKIFLLIISLCLICAVVEAEEFPAMFVIGDSLVDCGNNNYLRSFARSDFMPYGIDFYAGPTGRFSNGKTIIDFLGDLVGLPLLPPFEATITFGRDILKGVNYASAAAGILDESGRNLGDRFSLSQQVENFKSTLSQLKRKMDERKLEEFLGKSLVVMNLGSNDYINNYLIPSLYPNSSRYNSQDYADLLINHYAIHITVLHNLGLRKFLLAAVGPLGCLPNQIATGVAPPGKCVAFINDMVEVFNKKLISLVDQLNANHTKPSTFVYGNTYGVFTDILNRPDDYGFSETDKGCCGIGKNRGQITCLPFAMPCFNRDQYVFWDAYHPTQAFNQIVAQRAYTGGLSDCYPMNVKQMAQV